MLTITRVVLVCLCGVQLGVSAGKAPVAQPLPEVPVIPTRTNLFADLVTNLDKALEGHDPVVDRRMLVEKNDETASYVHNKNHPAYPFHGFTGISVLGNGANCGHNATVVAPRILITAGHCWQRLGTPAYFMDSQGLKAQWRFLDRNGKLHYASAQDSRLLTNTIMGMAIDARMFVLKEPLPPSIEPVLWPHPDLLTKGGGSVGRIPRFIGSGRKILWPASDAVTNYVAWREGIRGGDSGSGSVAVVGTNLVLVSCFGGNLMDEGVNWRETAEALCRKWKFDLSIPRQVDLREYK